MGETLLTQNEFRSMSRIKEGWQAEIVRRDLMNYWATIPRLADMLYPELPMYADREKVLRAEGGEFVVRIARAASKKEAECSALLKAWESHGPQIPV